MGANLVGLKLALSFVDLRSQILGVYVATSPGFYLGFYFGWYRVLGITSSGGSTVGTEFWVSPALGDLRLVTKTGYHLIFGGL